VTQRRLASVEAAGTACWLLMDLFWMLEQAEAAAVAGCLTLLGWLVVFAFLPRKLADWAANGAVVCWVLMNQFWMLADQYERPELQTFALASVALSFLLLGVAAATGAPSGSWLRRFRRFRFRGWSENHGAGDAE
jgi:hypothetical protein